MSGCLPWIFAVQIMLAVAKWLALISLPWWLVMLPVELIVLEIYLDVVRRELGL